jgi:general secretion pathway protein D
MNPSISPRPPARARAIATAALCLATGLALAQAPPQTMITPNYKDADLGQIVEAVSQVTGKNFIIDPRVKAQVTMLSATPMSPAAFYEAFLAILQVHGFVAVPSGKVYKIIPDANARQVPANDLPDRVSASSDEIVTQVVTLKNVNAAQLVPILRPLIPQYGHLAAYPLGNVLIISDRANNVNRILRIIQRIDQSGDDEIEVIRLEHASAAEIVRVMNSLNQAAGAEGGGAQAKLIADERTNSVLVSGEKSQRLRLRALVAHLDTPLETGGGTQVRYLKYADAEKIATKLKEQVQASTTQAGAAAGGAQAAQEKSTTIWADPPTNALVITAPPKLMRQLMGVIDKLDIRRLEVQVEAIIVEVTGSKNMDLGVNWVFDGSNNNLAAGAFNTPIGASGPSIASVAQAALNPTAITASQVPAGFTIGVGRLQKTGINFAAILNAVSGKANTNIISTPTIVTLDNQEAQIKVATEVPFLTGQFSSTGASGTTSPGVVNPFQTIQRQEVGTILKLTPQITDDGTILLKIEQEVSSLIKSAIATVDVQTSKRVINTRVLANDGEIIVLGGLISDSVTEGEQHVPLLGSIPLIGNLFKTRSASKEKTNLMVFLRPKILIDGDQMATETEGKYNYIRNLQLQRNRGKLDLMPSEKQPLLPDIATLAPRPTTAVTPKQRAGQTPAPAPVPPSASPTTPPPDAAPIGAGSH